MKHLLIITLLLLLTACAGTKKIPEAPKVETQTTATSIEETTPIEKTEQVISENTTPVETGVETIKIAEETAPNDPVKKIVIDKVSNVFNHNNWNTLLQKHVSKQGNVNYKGLKTDRKALLNYISSLSENTPNDSWTKEEKLAFWINAYNAMTIDLILRHYPLESIKDIKDPWDQRYWKLDKKWYNLNEIEHEILRKMDDPRIHFGIVCASFSCPKLQNEAFEASRIDEQLTLATKAFLNDSNRNEISENNIKLSKIFQWFAKDFKQNGTLIDFLNTYSTITISAKAKKSFKDYNWDLNE